MQNYQKVVARLLLASHAVMYHPVKYRSLSARPGMDERKQYINASHRINRYLKAIGKELGLSVPLTHYVARHSWASAARSKNIPISVISEGMGHDSENTTRIYLASLDTTTIDKANRLILNSLCRE